MDERGFSFVRECPELKNLIDRTLKNADGDLKALVYALVEITWRKGTVNGIYRALGKRD